MSQHVARKRFGQNFLVDTQVIGSILAAIAPRRDDLIVDPAPYDSLSTLTGNAPTVDSPQLPANYRPSQAYWSVKTGFAWAHQTERGRHGAHAAALCDLDRLVREHRHLESVWAKLQPQLESIAHGGAGDVDVEAIRMLVTNYQAHARYEEDVFLPLAKAVLSRQGEHMAALGLRIHMRHTPLQVTPF
mgnify:CR=1 FL=1